MRLVRLLVFLGLVGFGSAAIAGVEVDFDTTVDFSKYSTYAWDKGTPAPRPHVEEWIVAAIERELEAKGLQKTDAASADLLVASYALAHADPSIGGYYYSPTWDVGVFVSDIQDFTVGTLMVELVDHGMNLLVWRGSATKTLGVDDMNRLEQKIDKVTRKMFKKFPPS